MSNEANTCRKYVEPKLEDAGWEKEPHDYTEQYYFTDGKIRPRNNRKVRGKRNFVDYLLLYNGEFPIAVVEAKRKHKTPDEGLEQAIDYAKALGVKFAYSTNGKGIVEYDFTTGKQSDVIEAFPSPAELWQRLTGKGKEQIREDVRELVRLIEPDVVVSPEETYNFAGVYSFGRGVFKGQILLGTQFSYKSLTRLKTGNLVYPKLMAWEGGIGIVPPECNGLVVSPEFPVFEVNESLVLAGILDIYFRIPSVWSLLANLSTGTNIRRRRLHPSSFLKFEIPLPPIEEQRRIVGRVEELRKKIEEARSIRWQALEEAEVFLKSVLSSLCFSNRYPSCVLGNVLLEVKNGLYKSAEYWGHGVPCVRMYNIDGPSLNTNQLQLLDVTPDELDVYSCQPGDLIFNRVNSAELVGKTGLVTKDYPKCVFEAMNMRLRVDRSIVLPEYVALILNSNQSREYYRQKLKQQCGMASINQSTVRSSPLPLPPLPEQHRIVAYLNSLQAKVDQMKRFREEALKELDAMLPSILDKAFKGEL
jgi:restriction endonuclease S subunit